MPDAKSNPELVTITIDDNQIQVPKGMNIIEAARLAGVEIPHYCYHPSLSIAGNCRMCQVEIEGAPKLGIACNMQAAEGLKIKTQQSSERVSEAQQATLEFLLINHPLDCTVCDQAGHCKLQDYYYEYNAKGSRFIEDKVNQVKAEPLGPEIIYDGERCIVCTRCVRFCDEVSETGELGVFNRGDRAVIGTAGSRELDNPLAGSVVDLCPVGALTHRRWRFNTRIWYADLTESVCAGCSTGCNCSVAVRDNAVVQVKGRYNPEVNQEWMCDEGRYGFERFQPTERLIEPMVQNAGAWRVASWADAFAVCKELKGAGDAQVFLSPRLTLEEIWLSIVFAERVMGVGAANIAIQLAKRSLSSVEQRLVSPDYAPNARAASLLGLGGTTDGWRDELERRYRDALARVKSGAVARVLLVGDEAIRAADLDDSLVSRLRTSCAVALTTNQPGDSGSVVSPVRAIFPSRTINEKNGILVNKDKRLQVIKSLLSAPFGTFPEWMLLKRIADSFGVSLLPNEVTTERDLLRHFAKTAEGFAGVSTLALGSQGNTLEQLSTGDNGSAVASLQSQSGA